MSNRLTEILAHKGGEISRLDTRQLRKEAESAPAARDFTRAVCRSQGEQVKLIAELKRASPSKGLLAPHLDLAEVARVYVENGAAAISVLTDEKYFLGNLATLSALRFERGIPIPLLRKDFILAPAQVYETRANGADAILLIVAALPDDAVLMDLHALALDVGLTALVEVHTASELERALRLPALRLVGINNRDLTTFQVSLSTCEQLVKMVPSGVRIVSESGISSAGDVERMAQANVDAVLVGEALITAADIGLKVRELSGGLTVK
jgi:indole-3-glycerol phosphate synthase